ncbi:6-phosphofructokinase [Propionispora sp. 2/2-37]|uniref:6-phosphofructokinase n=1 Tax=Propionispora sp. 2/2-37 TaxID=1677858 RepID=UPI0006BB9610|nr:6-phosphofructokinase [Propionispora sp. 2/2-37]CUH94098.1 6-phosphofructokinase [Propionispora sp. 2/2-37]
MAQRIAVLSSGGDAPGMNAAIRAVVRKGLYHGFEMIGVERGYDGVIDGKFMPMNAKSVSGIIQYGGTVLKTARSESFKTSEGFIEAINQLKRFDIDSLVVIGGDGSMRGAMELAEAGIKTMVIPATIDNDMSGTDYTIGFDTALNTVLDAVNKIRDTTASHERVAIVEVMGRHAGHIALMAGLACGAEIILLPERPMDIEGICERLQNTYRRGKLYSIIMLAEGVAHGFDIAKEIDKNTTFKPHVTVLGYIQRGGMPLAKDNIMASRMGGAAIDSIIKGEVNRLVAVQQGKLVTVPYAEAVNYKNNIDLSVYELAGILAT